MFFVADNYDLRIPLTLVSTNSRLSNFMPHHLYDPSRRITAEECDIDYKLLHRPMAKKKLLTETAGPNDNEVFFALNKDFSALVASTALVASSEFASKRRMGFLQIVDSFQHTFVAAVYPEPVSSIVAVVRIKLYCVF